MSLRPRSPSDPIQVSALQRGQPWLPCPGGSLTSRYPRTHCFPQRPFIYATLIFSLVFSFCVISPTRT